jgi:hypothetical protein
MRQLDALLAGVVLKVGIIAYSTSQKRSDAYRLITEHNGEMGNVSGKPATWAVRFKCIFSNHNGNVCFACHC